MIHEVKEMTEYFMPVIGGIKTFEVRKNDRNYQEGDYLALNEMVETEEGLKHTGRSCLLKIIYVLDDERFCKEGYVVLGFRPCRVDTWEPCAISDGLHTSDYIVPLV